MKRCAAEPLADEEIEKAQSRFDDLEFLITPHQWILENDAGALWIGTRLAHWRRSKRFSAETVANSIGRRSGFVYSLERGTIRKSGAKFLDYTKYSDFIVVPMSNLCAPMLPEHPITPYAHPEIELARCSPRGNSDDCLPIRGVGKCASDQPEDAVDEHERPSPHCLSSPMELPGTRHLRSQGGGGTGSSTVTDLAKNKQTRYENSESLLLETVEDAVKALRQDGKRATRRAIAQLAGVSRGALEHYPQVKIRLEQIADEEGRAKPRRQRENELVTRVQQAIAQLQSSGERTSQRAIAQRVGLSQTSLSAYPAILAIFSEMKKTRHCGSASQLYRCDDEVVSEVLQVIETARLAGRSVTKAQISEAVGHSLKILSRNPQVRAVLDAMAVDKASRRDKTDRIRLKQVREDELIRKVSEAVTQLRSTGRIPTQSAIAAMVGLSVAGLKYYERVKTMLEDVARARRASEPRTLREEELVARIYQIIAEFEHLNKPTTQTAISERLHMSVTAMKKHAAVKAILVDLGERYRRRAERQHEHRNPSSEINRPTGCI